MSKSPPPRASGKLSFCLECKEDTETVIIVTDGIFWPIKNKRRVCRKCGSTKPETILEMGGYR